MKRQLMMGLVAAGLAFGSGTTAHAANENHVGWLLQQLSQQQSLRESRRAGQESSRADRRCLRQRWRNGRWVTYKDQRCLDRRRDRVQNHTPPRQCLRRKWTRQGWLTYYDNRCLERRGYDTGHRTGNRWRDRDDDD